MRDWPKNDSLFTWLLLLTNQIYLNKEA